MKRWVRRLFRKASQIFTPLFQQGFRDFGWSSLSLLPRTKIDYAKEVGDGLTSSVLMSPVKWVQRQFPEADLQLVKMGKTNVEILPDSHPLLRMLQRPNKYYTGNSLWAGTIFSYIVSGDGYWVKIREDVTNQNTRWWDNITGPVRELWYIPHWQLMPKGSDDGTVFIERYEYSVNATVIKIHPNNVIHFRNGLDPRNPRQGLSLVASELREIFTDDECANMIASLMRNMGVPGVVISPEAGVLSSDEDSTTTIGDVEEVKQYIQSRFTGDKRGEALILGVPTKVQQYGFNPQQLAMDHVRNVAEERICAAIGVPAAVVGFGTGLQQTKVGATMYELIKLAWHGCIIPLQKSLADQLELSLLPEFEPKPELFQLRFNLSNVSALAEDQKAVIEKLNVAVQGGWLRVDHAQTMAGFTSDPTQAVYLRGFSTVEIAAGGAKSFGFPQQKLLKEGSPIVQAIIDGSEVGKPSRAQTQLVVQFQKDAVELEQVLEEEMEDFFKQMGAMVSEIALDVLEEEKKTAAEDEAMAERIMARLNNGALKEKISSIGEAHYLRVSKATYRSIRNIIGLAVDLPDARARLIMAAGGRQLGLVDLTKATKKRLFQELTAGRELGEGPIELARRIRDFVPAGTWSTPKTRARVIARTETLHAQRLSALDAYRAAENVSQVMVFDARLGPTDEECEALDGKIVSFDEAEVLMDAEHPNGTRAFSPVVV